VRAPHMAVRHMTKSMPGLRTGRVEQSLRVHWVDTDSQRLDVTACEDLASWMVTTTTRSPDSSNRYTRSIHRQGPRMKRIPAHRPVNSGPRRGNSVSGARDRLTRCRVSVEGCA
jgi:hypothetical protein